MTISNYFKRAYAFTKNLLTGRKSQKHHQSAAPSCDEDFHDLTQDLAQTQAELQSIEDQFTQIAADPVVQQYKTNSWLARQEAYCIHLRQDGDIITDPHTKIAYRSQRIQTDSNALVGEILIPVDTKHQNSIRINWQGSYNKDQWVSDLEKSPAVKTFKRNEASIMAQINNAISQHVSPGKKVEVAVTGHSLGGALSQMTFHALQKGLVNGTINAQNVSGLAVGTCNSPGVTKKIEQSSNTLCHQVHNMGITQKALFAMVGGDAVQTTGQGTILSNVDPKMAEVNLIKIHTGKEKLYQKTAAAGLAGGIAAAALLPVSPAIIPAAAVLALGCGSAVATGLAHTEQDFNKQTINFGYETFCNQNASERAIIEAKLKNKSSFINSTVGQTGRRLLHKALS